MVMTSCLFFAVNADNRACDTKLQCHICKNRNCNPTNSSPKAVGLSCQPHKVIFVNLVVCHGCGFSLVTQRPALQYRTYRSSHRLCSITSFVTFVAVASLLISTGADLSNGPSSTMPLCCSVQGQQQAKISVSGLQIDHEAAQGQRGIQVGPSQQQMGQG